MVKNLQNHERAFRMSKKIIKSEHIKMASTNQVSTYLLNKCSISQKPSK